MKRHWLLWLLLIAFVWLVVSRFTEIQQLVKTLAGGQWQWILAAVLLQVIYYIVYTALYQSAFTTVEVESRLRDLLPVTFASLFVNVGAPSGGASGAALFVDDAARRGQSAARATAGTVLVLVADFAAFTLVLIVGLIYLFLQHDLVVYEVVGAIILLLMTVGLAGALLLGLWQSERLRRWLNWLQQTLHCLGSRMGHPVALAADWADKHAAEFAQAAQAVAAHPRQLGRTLGVALLAHLVSLASLYTLFLAFHQPISVGPLVAGYAIGILFLIVSPTPMGIGVVEGVMPLVFISLNIPAEVATIVTLAFRGLTFWLPLGLGFVLLQRVSSFSAGERGQAQNWNVRVVAGLTALMGLINLLSAVTPSLADRLAVLRQFMPLAIRHGSHLAAALAGFALLLLAGSLWRRKRAAWWLTLVMLVISIISHLVKGLDYEEASLATGLALWLLSLRPYFHARSDTPSIRQGLRVLLGAFLFTLTYGVIGFYILDHHFRINFSLRAALQQTLVMLTQFNDPGLQPLTGFGRYFARSIYLVGAATGGYALWMLIRPVLVRQPATPSESVRARVIVEAHGRSALARLTLLGDKSYYFSPGGSVVAYVAEGWVAAALGDPIGPPEDAALAITGFREFCAQNDWLPAFWGALPDYLEDYQAAGFKSLGVGHEGIIDLATFTLSGKDNKNLRAEANRLTRLGYHAEIHQPPLPDALLKELRAISDEWLTLMHGREKRFFLGWFDDEYLRHAPVIAVHTPAGVISAFANVVPEYQLNEITIDLMRRRPEVESGTMDFLFVSLFEWAKTQGYASFNLGLSPLSGIGEHPDDPAAERTLHYIYEHINQFYNFKGLREFKAKFHPRWSPRYLVYPGPASLPAIALTLNRISSGDDFIWDYVKDLVEKRLKPKYKAAQLQPNNFAKLDH